MIAQGELEAKFNDVLCNEVGVTARFTGTLSSIVGDQNKWKFMKGISRLTRQMGEKVGALADAPSSSGRTGYGWRISCLGCHS